MVGAGRIPTESMARDTALVPPPVVDGLATLTWSPSRRNVGAPMESARIESARIESCRIESGGSCPANGAHGTRAATVRRPLRSGAGGRWDGSKGEPVAWSRGVSGWAAGWLGWLDEREI
jgi:hypothetical protein